MGTCQRSTKGSRGGQTCANNARPGERYCAKHSSGKRPGGSRSRKKSASGGGCGGLFILALSTLMRLWLRRVRERLHRVSSPSTIVPGHLRIRARCRG